MRIILDMQAVQSVSRLRGIGRHTINLAKAIIKNKGEHEILLALNGNFQESIPIIRNEFNNLLAQDKIKIWYPLCKTDYQNKQNKLHREISECLYKSFLESLQPDLVHIFSYFEGYFDNCISSIEKNSNYYTSITLYDLIPYINPKLLPTETHKKWYNSKFNSINNADIFLTISNYTLNEGLKYIRNVSSDFYNISSGCTDFFDKQDLDSTSKEFIKNLKIEKDFIFYSGGLDEHKNVKNLIIAYSKLNKKLREDFQLVINCSSHFNLSEPLIKLTYKCGLKENEVIFTSLLSDLEMRALYNSCQLFIFPSIHEDFGLPLLEAMQCGAAVIGSNLTSIPEIIGCKDALFDPYNIESISSKIEEVLTNENFRQKLIFHASKQLKKFSWNNSAKIALKAFENTVSSKQKTKKCLKHFEQAIFSISQKINSNITEEELCQLSRFINLNFPAIKEKTIFVDISELYQNDAKTGIQRVTRSIMQELLISPPKGYKIEAVYATEHTIGYYYAQKNIHKIFDIQHCVNNDTPIIFQSGDIFLGLDLQCRITIAQNDFLKFMHNHGVKIKFLVHDLLPVLIPNVFPNGTKQIHKKFLNTLAQFDGVICVSNTVKNELKQWYEDNKILVSYNFHYYYSLNGSDIENSIPSKGLPKNYTEIINKITSKRSILMVSTIEPRKGHAQAIEAVELLWAKGLDINLVIVGKQGWDVDSLIKKITNHTELNNRLFWLKGISDEYLDLIYQTSTVVLMASLGEGFGLALIEAARHNIPLIVRDLPVFKEVAGEHAFYFSGNQAEDLSQAIEKWLELNILDKAPTTKDMPILTWKESTQNLLKCLLD